MYECSFCLEFFEQCNPVDVRKEFKPFALEELFDFLEILESCLAEPLTSSLLPFQLSILSHSIDNHRKQEIDPDDYQAFREGVATLTPTERAIFDHYVEGKEPKEIMEILGIKENTLKYHNKHIFGKLGVANRKELLRYVSLMK